ncbi:MAG: glycosyltransferase family 4 protein [Candidatus Baldrarchaeia archaeon]
MNILIVSLAWSLEMTGPNIRVFSFAKYLSKFGKKVKVTFINDQYNKSFQGFEVLGVPCLSFFPRDKIERIVGLTFILTLFTEIFYSIKIFHLIKQYKPQVVLVEETHSLATPLLITLRFLCKLFKINTQIVLDKHNIILHLISSFKSKWKRSMIVEIGKILTYFLEKIGSKIPDKIIVVSDVDKKLISKLYGRKEKIFVVQNGVDLEKFKPDNKCGIVLRNKLKLSKKKIILFLGGLNYLPNLDAVEFFIENILPKIKEKIPNITFVVVGKCPEKIRKKYGKDSSVLFTGFVKDEVPYINMADVCVAPLRMGGGTRIKVLSYMACSKVVIATPKAIEGLNLNIGNEILVADLKEFADTLISFFKYDTKKINEIAYNARKKVEIMYSWEELTKKLLKILCS